MKNSLPAKLKTLKQGECFVIPCMNMSYQVLMRNIGGIKLRNESLKNIKYKKAQIIVDDEMFLGVYVVNGG